MRRSFNSQHTEIATTLTGALALHSEVRALNRNPRSALPPPAQSQHRLNKHSGKTGSPPFSSSDAPWDVSTFCQAILALRCWQAARPFCGGMLPLLLQLASKLRPCLISQEEGVQFRAPFGGPVLGPQTCVELAQNLCQNLGPVSHSQKIIFCDFGASRRVTIASVSFLATCYSVNALACKAGGDNLTVEAPRHEVGFRVIFGPKTTPCKWATARET